MTFKQFPVLGLLLLAAGLPLFNFDQSLWRDEASSVWFAHLPVPTLLAALCDPHPPGYYLFLKAWQIGGQDEFWLRLPSLLAAVLAVALTYRLGREGCGRRCAWLAALLLACHPLQIWYAGEVRMYALVQSLGIGLVWLGWQLSSNQNQAQGWWSRAIVYWFVAVIAFGVDYVFSLPFALVQLVWLAKGRPGVWRWLGLQAGALLAGVILWVHDSQLSMLAHSYHPVFIAVQANRLGFALSPAQAAGLLKLAVLSLTTVSLIGTWIWFRRSAGRRKQPAGPLLIIGIWLVLLLLAGLPRAFTVKRHLVVMLPYLALVTTWSLARAPRLYGQSLAVLGLLVTSLVLTNHQREPWRAVITDLVRPEPNTVIWVDELAVPVFHYYVASQATAENSLRWTPFFIRDLPELPNLTPQAGRLLWIVTAENIYRNPMALLPLDFHRYYQLIKTRRKPGIGLYLYRRLAAPTAARFDRPAPGRIDEWGTLLPSPLATCRSDADD